MRIGLAHILGSDIGHAPTFHAIPAVQLRSFADDNRDQGGGDFFLAKNATSQTGNRFDRGWSACSLAGP